MNAATMDFGVAAQGGQVHVVRNDATGHNAVRPSTLGSAVKLCDLPNSQAFFDGA